MEEDCGVNCPVLRALDVEDEGSGTAGTTMDVSVADG